MIENSPEIQFALKAVRYASLLTRQVRDEVIESSMIKEDLSPVTITDLAVQALVAALLCRSFPKDLLMAEEDSSFVTGQPELLGQVTEYVSRFIPEASANMVREWIDRGAAIYGNRFWTLDPIDGTKGYLRGDQYAIALALVEDGRVEVAALGCPHLSDGYRPDSEGQGSLILAKRGQGCWHSSLAGSGDFLRLAVSRREEIAHARLIRSYEAEHTNVLLIDNLVNSLQIRPPAARMDSQAKYAILAAGKGEAMIRPLPFQNPSYREKIWDVAAGALIVEEAGGRVTDLEGRLLDFNTGRVLENNRGVLATNGKVHAALLQALEKIHAE